MPNTQLHDLAVIGAQSRLATLDQERDEILKMFPDLRDGQPAARRNGSPRARKGRTMSAADRRAVSERMRAYWAERRAKKAGAKGASVKSATKKSSGKAAKRQGGMSAEARKAQGERMKAYWAAKRAEKHATATAGGQAEGGPQTNGKRATAKSRRRAGRKHARKR